MGFLKINGPTHCFSRDFKSLSRRKVLVWSGLVWSVQSVVTAGTGCNLLSLVLTITELQLDVFCRNLFLQLQVDLWSQHKFLVVSSDISGCDLIFLVPRN